MNRLCMEAAVSQEYQDYLVEYYGDEKYLTDKYGEGCYQIISERFAIAYVKGDEVRSGINGGAFFVPACYGSYVIRAGSCVRGDNKSQKSAESVYVRTGSYGWVYRYGVCRAKIEERDITGV